MATNPRRLNQKWMDGIIDSESFSSVVDFDYCLGAAIQINITSRDSPTEPVFSVQGSIDAHNWTDVANPCSITNDTDIYLINVVNIYFRYLRLRVSLAGGSITLTSFIYGKGAV